jgi:two-component system response regulator CpxR
MPDWTAGQRRVSVDAVQSCVKDAGGGGGPGRPAATSREALGDRPIRPRILIIDDDRELATMLAEFLDREGFEVGLAHEAPAPPLELPGGDAAPDLVVLDVMLPGRSGFDLLRELRAREPRLPILMLTARGDAVDRILGLELGADDYLSKPFDPRELAARVRAVLRRAQAPPAGHADEGTGPAELQAGPLHLDLARRRAVCGGVALELTGAEFRVLARLARDSGRLVDRAELTEHALGRKLTLYDRSIDTHVSNLRRKLERTGARGLEIRAVRGAGYELLADPPP